MIAIADNTNNNWVACNEVTGTSNSSFAAQFGIWGNVNTNTTYSCNELNMLGRGFNMTGPQPMNTRLQVNHMTNTNVGIAIDNAGIIGDQGLDFPGVVSFPFDNCWNSGITHHTRTFGAPAGPTDGALSPFLLRPGTTSDCWNLGGSFNATFNFFPDIETPVSDVTATPLFPLWDCPQFTCTNGIGAPAFPFNTNLALRIAGDSIEYPYDSLDYRWWVRKSLYRALAQNDSILEQSTALRNFFDNYEFNSALPKFDDLRRRVYDFLFGKEKESYNSLSEDIELALAAGLQEENMKKYILSYLQYNYGDEPDTALSRIWEIATQCVFNGGPSVLEARALLIQDSLELIVFAWDTCSSDSAGGGGSKMGNAEMIDDSVIEHEYPKVPAYKLIPNLFKDDKTANITLGLREDGYVEIFNITGISVQTFRISEGNNTLDLNKLTRGVFIYKVFVNGAFKNNDKLVVLE